MAGIWGLAATITRKHASRCSRPLFRNSATRILDRISDRGNYKLGGCSQIPEGYKAIFHVGAGFTAFWEIAVMLIPESKIYRKEDLGEEQRRNFKKRCATVHQGWQDCFQAVLENHDLLYHSSSGFNWQSRGSQVHPLSSLLMKHI